MKIGIFDSGLGGLLIGRAIRERLPEYDMMYLGDTLRVPYGGRSREAVYEFSRRAVDFLFKQDCALVIVACNTASANALRQLQQEYLPEHYPERRILGVVIPTLETAIEHGSTRIGLLATEYIARSRVYEEELRKLNPKIELFTKAAPLLVPLIEHNGAKWLAPVLQEYLQELKDNRIESLILGCTHYPFLKPIITNKLGDSVHIISQDDIIPEKLADYLKRHPEIETKLGKNGGWQFMVTDLTQNFSDTATQVFGRPIDLEKIAT